MLPKSRSRRKEGNQQVRSSSWILLSQSELQSLSSSGIWESSLMTSTGATRPCFPLLSWEIRGASTTISMICPRLLLCHRQTRTIALSTTLSIMKTITSSKPKMIAWSQLRRSKIMCTSGRGSILSSSWTSQRRSSKGWRTFTNWGRIKSQYSNKSCNSIWVAATIWIPQMAARQSNSLRRARCSCLKMTWILIHQMQHKACSSSRLLPRLRHHSRIIGLLHLVYRERWRTTSERCFTRRHLRGWRMISSSRGCRRWLRLPLPLPQVVVAVLSLLFKCRRSSLSRSLTAT